VADYGLTPEGINIRTFADIRRDVLGRQRAWIHAGFQDSANDVVGQMNAAVAEIAAEIWELMRAIVETRHPDAVTGALQDALYAIQAIVRKGDAVSTVNALVTLDAGANIAIGDAVASVNGNTDARFENAEAMVNSSASSKSAVIKFQALTAGPVVANAGTLTVRETLPTGWQSITNPGDATLGFFAESNAAFRARRELSIMRGSRHVNGIRAELLNLSTVRDALVRENITNSTDPDTGMPPHAINAVLNSSASDDAELAEVISETRAAGIKSWGSTTVAVTDEGGTHNESFSRPVKTLLYLNVRIYVGPDYIGDDALKALLIQSAEDASSPGFLRLGTDVFGGQFVVAMMASGTGIRTAEARISTASTTFDQAQQGIIVAPSVQMVLDANRITITRLVYQAPANWSDV